MSLRYNPNPTTWTCPECGANNMACFMHCSICRVYFDHGDDSDDDDEMGEVTATEEGDVDDTEEVEIVAVVPVGDPVPEAADVTGLDCPICLREFDNGEQVVILSCGGSHVMCKKCHKKHGDHDRQAVLVDELNGAEVTMFEIVRRVEGADKCPVCRRMSHCAIEARAWSRPGSKNNAINVDGE